jgi:hypothetical protein
MATYDIPIGFEQSTLDVDNRDFGFESNPAASKPKTITNTDGKIVGTATLHRVFKPGNHPITVNADNQRLGTVLDDIVQQMKHYKWEINDDVVNIFPKKGRDERFKEILSTKIAHFSVPAGKLFVR